MVSKWAYLDEEYRDKKGSIRKVFNPHFGQLMFMEDQNRFLACTCGRRLGKSTGIAHEFIPEALATKSMATTLEAEGKRREFWTVGPNYSDAEKPFRAFWDKCKALGLDNAFDKPGTYFSLEGGNMTVSLWDGRFIYSAKSAAMPERLVGEALSGVHMEEAAKQKEIVWQQMIMPTLSDMNGWAKFTTTPEGKNWYYDLHMKALRPGSLNWNAYRIPSWYNTGYALAPYPGRTIDKDVYTLVHLMAENPHMTSFEVAHGKSLVIDETILQLANDQTLPEFQQEIMADFTDFVGRVFKEFNEETHVAALPWHTEPSWETVAAVDYGYRNPNVWLLMQIGPWGEINIIDELYQSDLTPSEFAHEILRKGLCPDSLSEFYPDPASPGDTATLETIFRQAGKRAVARGHTGGELDNRLNLIRLAFKNRIVDNDQSAPHWFNPNLDPARQAALPQDLRRPQMMVSFKCPNTIRECTDYRYPKTRDESVETSTKRYELPMKKDDHTPEAIGRCLASRYHSAATQFGGGTRVTRGRFMRNGMRSHPNGGSYGAGSGMAGGMNGAGWLNPDGTVGGGYASEPAGIPERHGMGKPRGPWNS